MVDSNYQAINLNQEFQAGPELYGSVFPYKQVEADCRHLWNLGFRYVRVPLKQWGSRQIDIDWQRIAAPYVKSFGFYVDLGSGQHNLPGHQPKDWDTLYDFILNNEIPWILTQNFDSNDTYYLGNENELAPITDGLATISRTSNVVTCVYAYKHKLATGDNVEIQLSDLGITNGNRSVTVIDEYTFTFSNTGSDVAPISNPSSSTNKFRYGTDTTYKVIKRLATKIRTDIPTFTLKLAYSCVQGIVTNNEANTGNPYSNVYNIDRFVSLGRGDLDYVDLNMYSDTATGYDSGLRRFKAQIDKGYAGFGPDHFRVTEWNLWENTSNYYGDTAAASKNIAERLDFFKSKTGLRHYFFCYRWQNTNFLQVVKPHNKVAGRVYRDWWWVLIGKRQPTVEITNNNPIQVRSTRLKPATQQWDKVGFNMGQYEQSGTYNSTKVANDLDFLYKAGVRKLRIASGSASYYLPGYTACWNLIQAAKAKGFYTVKALNGDPTDATWNDYVSMVLTEAALCEERGIDELGLTNEIDAAWRTPNLTDRVNKIKSLATSVKSVFNGVVSAALAQDGSEAEWIATGKGDLDIVGYNVYGSDGNFQDWKNKITALHNIFGNDLHITEWNLHHTWSQFPSESLQPQLIADRFAFLQEKDIFNYFFTWNWDHANDQFALKKADGTFRPWYGVFFKSFDRELASGREAAAGRETLT